MSELCSGCGACIGVCPRKAINPTIRNGIVTVRKRSDACTDCNLCIRICPVFAYAFSESIELKYNENSEDNTRAFICHATDNRVRWNGASGGVVTALLLHLLREKIIDGVLATKTEGRTHQSYIAKKEEDILASQGSTYFPTFGLKHLRELSKTCERYVVVGLPCQIDALQIAQNRSHSQNDKLFASFGLFCFHINEPWYLDYILRRICKIDPEKVSKITARKGGWPGHITILSTNQNEAIPYSKFMYPLPLYHFTSPLGCLYCANRLNVNADLSFGDAWLQEFIKSDNLGSSIVVARTKKGLSILEDAESRGILHLQTAPQEVVGAQSAFNEKSKISIRRNIIRGQSFLRSKPSSLELLDALLPIFHASIARDRFMRKVVFDMPRSLTRIYCRLCGLVDSSSSRIVPE